MNTDIVLGHAQEELRKLDIDKEWKVLDLPVHIQEVQ